ncbi:MAG: PCRF domain-containing protein [Patescibacteria group bacterium]
MDDIDDKKRRIKEIEGAMTQPDFWGDKNTAQSLIQELNDIKLELEGANKYDKGGAVITILAGAGGADAEDFALMLFLMYQKYIQNRGWKMFVLHKNENDHNGYRNITFEIKGKDIYGILKNESGVHRLVRISPFNAKSLRHTSFAMVDIIPKFQAHNKEVEIPESDLSIDFTKSSGPGGQNANKRETAVRIVHIPTKISVCIDSERSQAQNREKAMEILEGKLYKVREEMIKNRKSEMQIASSTEIAWGNQIRSYVLHPYKMVKDHRTGVETRKIKEVLEDGEIDEFIEAEKNIELN